ncbi:hypothetical protein L0244_26885 [bacterium]|nr:hypothetical protein [bacterium]
MKAKYYLILLLTFPSLAYAQLSMDLKIIPRQSGTYCEPLKLSITWRNESNEDIKVGPSLNPTRSPALTIYVNDMPNLKFPVRSFKPLVTKNLALKPGESSEGTVEMLLLYLSAGVHQIKAVADFRNINIHGLEDMFQGTAESNVVEFTMEEPSGDNLEAWKYASQKSQEKHPKQKMIETCGALSKPEILKLYPDSIYASWIVWERIDDPLRFDPQTLSQLIKEGDFPDSNSVPDPDLPDGWQGIRSGKSMAQWQLYWAERILRTHPDFPLPEQLQLAVALNKLVLNDKTGGQAILSELSTHDSDIGKWSKQFIELK